jgi:elongator complex protein 4
MKTSFVRKKDATGSAMVKELPLGCFPCTFNSNVLFCSTGLHELDDLCGGGALVGGMFGVEQDEGLDLVGCFFFPNKKNLGTRHWNSLARYFASEGVASGQGVVVVGAADADAAGFLRSDIAATSETMPQAEQVTSQPQLNVDGVKIAWRYKAQLQEKSVSGSAESKRLRRCHWFDLSKSSSGECAEAIAYGGDLEATFASIEHVVERFNLGITGAERSPPILRLVLLNFGSGLWYPAESLQSFLFRLRALVRRSLCACFICVAPTAQREVISRFLDQSVQLKSFEGSQLSGAAFPGFSGYLTLKKTVSLYASAQWRPDCRQFLFRRTRRTLQVERLYMPPEDKAQSSLACATTGGGGALDF